LRDARKAAFRPVVLCVLDGWGLAPDSPSNAVTRAKTPRLRALIEGYPHATLRASGRDVGLPDGVMGNSEVGHLTMGAGYIQYQELVRINDSIANGSFFENSALRAACAAADGKGTLHLMGLISTGGVHADMKHLAATPLGMTARAKATPRARARADRPRGAGARWRALLRRPHP